MRIGIIAPASVVPKIELKEGVARLERSGFEVCVHPQVWKRSGFFAGDDGMRARAFYEYSLRDDLDVIWCARGGYGASRILPLLDELIREGGLPPGKPKLLVGFSDITALQEYVRVRWGWRGLHAPMPGARPFSYQSERLWGELVEQIKAVGTLPFRQKLKWLTQDGISKAIQGDWLGGNLAVLGSLVGTPYSIQAAGGILFVEDIAEAAYRLDRTWIQLEQSGALAGVQAIVLGAFDSCHDVVPSVLKAPPRSSKILQNPRPTDLMPLRPKMSDLRMLREVFGQAGDRLGVPVAYGLRVGHGDSGLSCMPWGGRAAISPEGSLLIQSSGRD